MTVLIYRLGRIGDTMVALPSFKLIQRAFPQRRRILLSDRAPSPYLSAPHLLAGSGIIDDVIEYELGERRPASLWSLARRIRASGATTAIYLTEPRGWGGVLRDWAFLRACGLSQVIGLPLTADKRCPRRDAFGRTEPEAARLARAISVLGDAHLDDPANWRLSLSPSEMAMSDALLARLFGETPFVALDVSAKPPLKEWGDERWAQALAQISHNVPGLGALFTGALADRKRIDRLAACWQGPSVNLCGQTPREFHAHCRHARLFIGSDSGPAHLAAAAGVPCVLLCAAQFPPGRWDLAGQDHVILRDVPLCQGCGLKVCPKSNACINAIGIDQVVEACTHRLSELTGPIRVVDR